MKLLELVRPIDHEKKRRLAAQLELEKQRFKAATESAAARFRGTVLEGAWVREHPIEAALLIMLGGYCVARWSADRETS